MPSQLSGTHVSGLTDVSGRTDAWDPRVRSNRRMGPAGQVGPSLPPMPSQLSGTRVSGRADAWDPRVRSDQVSSVGPSCQVGPTRGTRVSGRTDAWDPRVTRGTCVSGWTKSAQWDLPVRSDWRMGPTCQSGSMCGTGVLGRTDAWDPHVRSDLQVGPACHDGLIGGTHVSGWTYRWATT
jgi:hypothetical protein